jgi:hypothetical protein
MKSAEWHVPLPIHQFTRRASCMNANATSLVRRFAMARAQVEALIDVAANPRCIDLALVEESEAETALREHVKIATGRCPTRRLHEPVAAAMDGVLVVVAPDPSAEWDENIFIIHRRDIASGE